MNNRKVYLLIKSKAILFLIRIQFLLVYKKCLLNFDKLLNLIENVEILLKNMLYLATKKFNWLIQALLYSIIYSFTWIHIYNAK